MADTVSAIHVRTYESTVRHLAQQSMARFMHLVDVATDTGKSHTWNRLGQSAFTSKGAVGTATASQETPWTTRKATASAYKTINTLATDDIAKILVDAKSAYAQSHANAYARHIEATIFAAAVGNAPDEADAANAFGAGQTIGDYTTYITFDMITEASEKLMNNDVDPDLRKAVVISPKQARKMLQMTEFTSSEYNRGQVAALNSPVGYLPSFMGYEWIVSNQLNYPVAGDVDCLVVTERAIGLYMPMSYTARVAQDPSHQFDWVIYGEHVAGAVRVEDEQIIRLKLKDD